MSNRKLTTAEFIRRAKEVHGNKYDYSKSVYVNTNTKLIIICRQHGKYLQSPHHHVNRKCGCKKCSYANISRNLRVTVENFIEKAKLVHANKYDYSKSVYINNATKLIITCQLHGDFEQIPYTHLYG